MNSQQSELYQRIQNFSIDDPQAEYPFSKRLARENNWSDDYTKRVIEEYKKFAFLCTIADHSVTPSQAVDKVWHLHLIYTHSYWEKFCSQLLGKSLHHKPSRGGKEELEKYSNLYNQTLESYEYFFRQKPPEDIWLSSSRRFVQSENKLRLETTDNSESLIFRSGDIFNDRYQLQKRLGNTAKGHQTWLALDLRSYEQVAVKLLAFSPEIAWKDLELFEREAQILQELNHPKIPRYRDYFEIDKNLGGGVPWFALIQEHIPGASLQELLDQGKRFSDENIRLMTQEVLEILIYLHELNPPVLHRDIKPSNLILAENKQIYLVDFGAVQAQASVTGVTFSIVGTGGYAPLEQFYGRATFGSDLYALGATMIHLATGVSPLDLYTSDHLQFRDKVNLQLDLMSWLETVTDAMPKNRFSSAREALDKLKSRLVVANTKMPQYKVNINSKELELLVFYTKDKDSEYFSKKLWYSLNTPLSPLAMLIITLGILFSIVTFFYSVESVVNVLAFFSSIILVVLVGIIDIMIKQRKFRKLGVIKESSQFYFNEKIFKIANESITIVQGNLKDIVDCKIENNQMMIETKSTYYLSDYIYGANQYELERDIRSWLEAKEVKFKPKPELSFCCGGM